MGRRRLTQRLGQKEESNQAVALASLAPDTPTRDSLLPEGSSLPRPNGGLALEREPWATEGEWRDDRCPLIVLVEWKRQSLLSSYQHSSRTKLTHTDWVTFLHNFPYCEIPTAPWFWPTAITTCPSSSLLPEERELSSDLHRVLESCCGCRPGHLPSLTCLGSAC